MATATPGLRSPGLNDPSADENGSTKDQRRNSSLGFLRRSKSTEPLGSKSKKNSKAQAMAEELRRQEAMPKQPPRLPDLSPAPVLESFGGEEHHDNGASFSNNILSPQRQQQQQQQQPQQQPPSRSSISTDYDPYARTESMTHRGRYSYASSAVTTINNPRRLRRRKDPTPYK
jgi:hypothetical protein